MIENNIVSAPISLSELASLFECTQDVGTICGSNSINMWAKYKPFVSNDVVYKQDGGNYTDRDDALKSANYGITPRYAISKLAIRNAYGSTSSPNWGWTYMRTAVNKPKRIADFIHYDHSAIRPIEKISSNADNANVGYGEDIAVSTIVADVGEYNLKLSDLEAVKDGVYGLVIYNESAGTDYEIKGTEKVSDVAGLSFNLKAEEWVSEGGSAETCHIYPVIIVTDSAAVNSKKYYTIPGAKVLNFNVTKGALKTMTIKGVKSYTAATDKYELKSFEVTMTSNVAFTVSDLKIKVRLTANADKTSADRSIGEFEIEADTITSVSDSNGGYEATYSWYEKKTITKTLYNSLVLVATATISGEAFKRTCNVMASENGYTRPTEIIDKEGEGVS